MPGTHWTVQAVKSELLGHSQASICMHELEFFKEAVVELWCALWKFA
jgi:hypothetical protein